MKNQFANQKPDNHQWKTGKKCKMKMPQNFYIPKSWN